MRIFKQNIKAKLYISPRIAGLIERSENFPVTILEAPTGFGKSFAVQAFMEQQKEAVHHVYVATKAGGAKNWQEMVESFAEVGKDLKGDLINIEAEDNESLGELVSILQTSRCAIHTYLVIDNFELIQKEFHPDFIRALSKHEDEKLHFIICTKTLEGIHMLPTDKQHILTITHDDLRLDQQDMKGYFEENHIHLTPAELAEIDKYTGGWFEAINMQRLHFLYTGTFELSADIKDLLEMVVWQMATNPEKKGLLGLSFLESFTLEQAVRILDFPFDDTEVEKLLKIKEFIQRDGTTGRYHFDYILSDFLADKRALLPGDKLEEMANHVAGICMETGEPYKAFTLYQDVKNYRTLLRLCLTVREFSEVQSKELTERLERVLKEADYELLLTNPQAVLNMALPLFLEGKEELSKQCTEIVEEGIRKDLYVDRDNLHGQVMFMQIYYNFNDLDKMIACIEEAKSLLSGQVDLFGHSETDGLWLMGQPSVIYLYWRKDCSLEETLVKLEHFLSLYTPLMKGHGICTLQVLKAEREMMRGHVEASEIYSYEARYLSKNRGHIGMYIAADIKLLRTAVLKGDGEQFLAVRKDMEKIGKQTKRVDIHQMIEGAANCEPEPREVDRLPSWVLSLDREKTFQSFVAAPFYMIAHLKWLLSVGEYEKVIGLANGVLKVVMKYQFLFAEVHYLIFKGIAYKRLGNRKDYEACLREAFSYAVNDEVFYPFAEMGEDLHQDYIRFVDRDTAAKLQAFYQRFKVNGEAVAQALGSGAQTLSDREKEVVHLAKQGMTNKEIGIELLISAETVKVLLKRAFAKLEITSRKELKYIEYL